jgi:hypothetical protein
MGQRKKVITKTLSLINLQNIMTRTDNQMPSYSITN